MLDASKRGFTLIELMVAITIIAILSVVSYVSYSAVQVKVRDSKRVADIQEIQKALEQYYQVNHGYPAVAQGNGKKTENQMTTELSSYFASNTPPSDPNVSAFPSNYEYTYYSCGGSVAPPSRATNYVVCAELENGGDGANADNPPSAPSYGCSPISSSGPLNYYCLSGQTQ